MLPEVALVNPVAVKLIVLVPATLNERLAKVAIPFTVEAVNEPCNVPEPAPRAERGFFLGGRGCGRLRRALERLAAANVLAADEVDGTPVDERQDPGAGLGALGQEAVGVAPDSEEGLLDVGEVVADPDRLAVAFDALIENAVQHTQEQDTIEVGVRRRDGMAAVSFRDTGTGIPTEDLDRIFDRFARADPGRSRHTGGFGLGLSIVRAIVEAHDGEVQVMSTVGVGTTFEMDLPLETTWGPGHASAQEMARTSSGKRQEWRPGVQNPLGILDS